MKGRFRKNFGSGANQNTGVQHHHPAEARLVHLGGPAGDHIPLMAPGNAQFAKAQNRDDAEKNEVGDNA